MSASIRDQLGHLDHLVTQHETFWAASGQQHPTPELREFLRLYWGPWLTSWWTVRPYLDTAQGIDQLRAQLLRGVHVTAFGGQVDGAAPDLLAPIVHEAARRLTYLRDVAAYNGIATPDLGTAQHGFGHVEEPRVAGAHEGLKVSEVGRPTYNAGMSLDHYRNAAIHAVTMAQQQSPSPVYGYLRRGAHQKIYLFPVEHEAIAWFDQRGHLETGYDYAAVFVAPDLRAPIVEDVALAAVSGDPAAIGAWFLPLALGLPAGAAGGYAYRKWQEANPGKIFPWISGDPSVGSQWVDIVGRDPVGSSWASIQDPGGPRFVQHGPWTDIVGADVDAARLHAWPQTKALIQAAIRETVANSHQAPAAAYVWSLEPYGGTRVVPFATHDQALAYMRDRIHTDHAALALFDRASPHWPNPVNWTKSDDPANSEVIAWYAAHSAHDTRAAGEIVGGDPWQSIIGGEPWESIIGGDPWQSIIGGEPWQTIVGSAVDVLRRQAQAAAEGLPNRVVGTVRDADNKWKLKGFSSSDDADSWFAIATRDPRRFTYAAYFDKGDVMYPHPLNETIGSARAPAVPAPIPRVVAEV